MQKYLSLGLYLGILVFSLGTVAAFAQTTATTTSATTVPGPMIVNIGPAGNVLLRGQITSIDADSLVAKSWGGSWTINVLATTNINSPNKLLSDFKVDDFVGVIGDMSADGDFEIDAKILRAWGRKVDQDHDGIPDNQDNDDDNDGVHNDRDTRHRDHDDDGVSDDVDSDDDNDGINDTEDSKPHDHDNDGEPDGVERRHQERNRGRGRGGDDNLLPKVNNQTQTMPLMPIDDRRGRGGDNSGPGSSNSGSN